MACRPPPPRVAHLPPVSILFAAFLGDNPVRHFVRSSVLHHLTAHNQALLTGRSFFPKLISAPFSTGLHEALAFAIVACLIAGAASLMRGGQYHAETEEHPTSSHSRATCGDSPRREHARVND